MTHRVHIGVLLMAALLAVFGCRPPPPIPLAVAERDIVGHSVEGRPIDCIVIGTGSVVLLIVASIHGNETGGTPLVRQLVQEFGARPRLLQDRKVVIIPVANPDGMARQSRYNARGVDLNRNFAASNWFSGPRTGAVPFSEPETRAIARVIQAFQPEWILSIHEPLECIDYDGPAEAEARRLSDISGLPLRRLGGRPGSLGSYAGVDQGIPTVTLELPLQASQMSAHQLWSAYGRIMTAAVLFPMTVEEAALH